MNTPHTNTKNLFYNVEFKNGNGFYSFEEFHEMFKTTSEDCLKDDYIVSAKVTEPPSLNKQYEKALQLNSLSEFLCKTLGNEKTISDMAHTSTFIDVMIDLLKSIQNNLSDAIEAKEALEAIKLKEISDSIINEVSHE